jgi:hypothetical protein
MIDLIAQQQVKAKIADEQQRMKEAAIAIDFYNGVQKQHMESVISQIYPATWLDIRNYLSTSNITQGVINQKSILFQSPPEVEIITSETGESKPLSEKLNAMLTEILEKAEFNKKLIASDRMAELTGKVLISQHWHAKDERVVLDVITPDKAHIVADPDDPTKAIEVYYRIGVEKSIHQATPVNIYAKWTVDTYSKVEMSDSFTVLKETDIIPNQYGYIPVIALSTLLEIDSFWVDHGYPVVEGNINVNLRESNLDLALDYQSFSTLVEKGVQSTKDTIAGITRKIYLPAEGFEGGTGAQAYYITPDAKLTEVSEIIQAKKIGIAKESGLSADSFNQDASKISSGYQLRLTQKQVEENNDLKKEMFRQPLTQLIKNIIACYNISNTQNQFPGDIDIYFNYIDKKSVSNPIEAATLQITRINAGLMSLADAIRENNPSLSQEEAIEEAKRIKQEQREINGGSMITPQDLGIN